MKKRILLFTAVAGMFLGLSSYITGPGTNGYDCTGAETGLGNQAGCSNPGASCHSTSATAGITVALTLDSAGAVPVTSYVGGMTYTVTITGTNTTTNNLPKFGFQVGAITGSSAVTTPTNAGTLQSTGLPTGVHYKAGPGSPDFVVNVVEHSTQLSPASGTGGSGTTYTESFTWTAPAAGTGTVSIWGALNAVNDNGTNDAGDLWNTTHIVLSELTVSHAGITNVANNITLKAFPNPVSTNLNLQIDNAQAGTYSLEIADMSGRIVSIQNIEVSGTTHTTNINTASWLPGTYHLLLEKDGNRQVIPVIKL